MLNNLSNQNMYEDRKSKDNYLILGLFCPATDGHTLIYNSLMVANSFRYIKKFKHNTTLTAHFIIIFIGHSAE